MALFSIVSSIAFADIEDLQWVWYSFQSENITGGEVHDVSNNSRNGTIVPGTGTIEYVEDTGFMGGAYNLTSYSFPSPYIWSQDTPSGLTHNYQWNYANNTLCVWLYPIDLNHSWKENVIFSEATSSLNSLWFGYDTNANPRFTDEKLGNQGDTWENYTTMSINEWHHICRVCNGTHVRAYLDGVELLPASNTGGVETLNRPITVGNARYRSGYGFTGMIDEFGAWQRDLSHSEILQLYNNRSGYIPPAYIQCVPNWTCSGYGVCNTSDLQPCNDTTDQNACGSPYTGGYSEFSPQVCDYCSEDIQLFHTDWGECQAPELEQERISYYQDLNYGSCCNVTSLPSDCSIFNGSFGNSTEEQPCFGAYSGQDLKDVVVDGLGTAGAETVKHIELIVAVLLLVFGTGAVVAWWQSRYS